MTFLTGKRILFFGIGFYDYERSIKCELERHGAEVEYICENHQNWFISKFQPYKWTCWLDNWYGEWYLHRKIRRLTGFDEVFVIKGERFTAEMVKHLKAGNPSAVFRLYQWDSIRRLRGGAEFFAEFGKVFTFDRLDHLSQGYEFRPLFFRRSSALGSDGVKYHISFVGWLHFDRLDIVRKLFDELNDRGLATYCYIFAHLKKWLMLALRGRTRGVHIRRLPYSEYSRIVENSGAVLDLPHPLQSGLTMRAIEALGAQRKLVTTSEDITHYDFYRKENILLMDNDTTIEDIVSFLQTAYCPVPDAIVQRYSISTWVRDIFGVGPNEPRAEHRVE